MEKSDRDVGVVCSAVLDFLPLNDLLIVFEGRR
jgi:hypothetical protein